MLKKLSAFFLIVSLTSIATAQPSNNYNNIYFFGDSLSAIGTLNSQGNATDCSTNLLNASANPQSPNTCLTWANGFYKLMKGHYVPLQVGQPDTIDYAVGGATTADLTSQITHFEQTHQYTSSDLYIIWMGGNDILSLAGFSAPRIISDIENNDIADAESFLNSIIDPSTEQAYFMDPDGGPIYNTLEAVGNLSAQQAGNNVIVMNLPNITHAPAKSQAVTALNSLCVQHYSQQECSELVNQLSATASQLVQDYNKTLAAQLATHYPQVRVFDAYSVSDDIYNGKYGQMNVTEECQGAYNDPNNKCAKTNPLPMFWNSIHPSWATHSLLASQLARFIS